MHFYQSYFYVINKCTIFYVNTFLLLITLLHVSVHKHHHQQVSLYTQVRTTIKVKVKFSLEQATKAQRGSRGIAILFLQHWHQMAVGGQCQCQYPWKRPGTHCIGWVVPRVDLDRCGKSHPHQGSIPRPPSPQRVTILTEPCQPTGY